MRMALLADIHGNSIALDAVLEKIAAQGGIDEYWILGDLVALGPDPVGVLDRLRNLPNTRMIRGNTDRYVAFGDRPGPSLDEAAAHSDLLPRLVEVAHTFAWTQGMITAAGWFDWLRALPLEVSLPLPDGTTLLAVHASPGKDDGPGIGADTPEPELQHLLEGCAAGLVCAGHTHRPLDRHWNGFHLVNPGAISLSLTPDGASSYAILDADERGYRMQHHSVAYDRQAVIEQLQRVAHPGRAFLIRHLEGNA